LKRFALCAILLSVMVGCSPMETRSVQDDIGLAYVSITTLAQSVASSRDDGVITEQQAQAAKVTLQRAKDSLDSAALLIDADPHAARGGLMQAQAILQAVIVLLEETS